MSNAWCGAAVTCWLEIGDMQRAFSLYADELAWNQTTNLTAITARMSRCGTLIALGSAGGPWRPTARDPWARGRPSAAAGVPVYEPPCWKPPPKNSLQHIVEHPSWRMCASSRPRRGSRSDPATRENTTSCWRAPSPDAHLGSTCACALGAMRRQGRKRRRRSPAGHALRFWRHVEGIPVSCRTSPGRIVVVVQKVPPRRHSRRPGVPKRPL